MTTNQAAPFGHAQSHIIRTKRAVTLYGWVNLSGMAGFDDNSGFAELIKLDLKQSLKTTRCVIAIGDYTDGTVSETFKPFTISDLDRRYDRWPFHTFKIDLVLQTIETRT